MKLYFDERQLLHAPLRELHNGEWTDYAETPDRILSILNKCSALPAVDHGLEPILAVHDADYIAFLREAHVRWRHAGREGDAIGYTFPVRGRRKLALDRIDAALGAYSFDASTPVTEHTWVSAYWSAQTALTALDAIAAGDSTAFALCRPPGHHAGVDYMGGYCYLNNAAIAARQAVRLGLGPVAILDVDYHHGNGTQDIFFEDGETLFVSLHADPATDYPFYWGHADEKGEGEGAGATLNLPLPRDTEGAAYLAALEVAVAAIDQWRPGLLVVSFGADSYIADPISHFRLETDDFRSIGTRIREVNLPTLVVLEGGYAVEELGNIASAFIAGIEGPES